MKSKALILFIGSLLFLTAGSLLFFFFSRSSSPQVTKDTLSGNIEKELTRIDRDAALLLEQFNKVSAREIHIQSDYPFFVFDAQQVISWSDNRFVPTRASVADTFNIKLLKAGNGDYLAKKWQISRTEFLVAIIPLYRKFNISNDYLSTWWNQRVFPSGNISILEPNASLGIAVCAQGSCPFKISFIQGELPVYKNIQLAAIISYSISIVLFAVFVYHSMRSLPYPEVTLLVLYAVSYGVRFLMIRTNFPNALYISDLFNPQVFASSPLNASLGDLTLNVIVLFLLCYYLFRNYQRFRFFHFLYRGDLIAWLLSVFAGICILFAMLFPFLVIQTIYNNSAIVLDISQSLDFDSIRIVALFVILLSGVCSFLFAHTFIRVLIADGNKKRVIISFLVAMVVFAGINTLTEQRYLSTLLLGATYFFLVFYLRLYSGLKRLTFATFSYLFISIFLLSANGAYAVQHFSRQETIDSQFKFADDFLIDRDVFGEFLLNETAMKISNDVFIQIRINTPFLNRDAIRQKIRQVFLPTYFNKYDIEIFLFNSSGESLNNRSTAALSEFVNTYDQEAYRTMYEGVYFVSSPSNEVAQKYLVRIPVLRGGATQGYVMLELLLKKIIPESVYPELLVDKSFQQFYHTQDFSYAVFTDNKVLFSSGKFNYDLSFNLDWLGNPDMYRTGITSDGYIHIALEDENDRVAVVSSRLPPRMLTLANFSFLMVFSLAIVLVFLLIQGIVNYARGEKLYFSARIQLLLNMAFFLPLLLVSITTLNLTSRSSQNQLNEDYLSKAESFSSQLSAQLDDYLDTNNESIVSFETQLTDLAKLTNLDANVYDATGKLLATSQPQIFENNLISNYINPEALRKINFGENIAIETEHIGRLEYFVSYAALKAPLTGKLIGILAIPFFQSGYSMERVQITILANILNIFVLIFIVLVILSYFVSLWLTFPLKFITQSLQRTSLTKMNQPLKWKADDEIGLMVREYNQMLYKLSESKAELEQNQRERTWREIAQQVAHEIKNPLTPMKLTLQQLQRSLQSETNTSEKTEKAVSSLLAQVETLNEIASSFSTFARMPEPVMQRLELVSLVKRIVLLHSQSGTLNFSTNTKEVFIQGDEQLLGRTFSNLILNALQSARPGHQQYLKIVLERKEEKVLLSFQDKGKGIEPHIAERIFLSHFSTKKSGSGLGLAIAKQAIEQMLGRIWFETVVGEGTTFFIELPAEP